MWVRVLSRCRTRAGLPGQDPRRAYTAEQVSKALELIADKGIVVSGMVKVFRAVSSDGTAYYLTAASVQRYRRAGLNGRRCYLAAVAALMYRTRAVLSSR